MKVQLVDPAAYTPPYDHALAQALAGRGLTVELATGPFSYGDVPDPVGYTREERFYRGLPGPAGSKLLRGGRLLRHLPDMLAWRRSTKSFDVVHAQWLAVQGLDVHLLPTKTPLVMTAHDVLPREPRPGQLAAQAKIWGKADAVVVHTRHGRDRLVNEVGLDPERVAVIPHGPLDHLAGIANPMPLPQELVGPGSRGERPVVLSFGLMRPYKGLDVLLDAWGDVTDAELWIVGRPRMDIEELRRQAPESVRFVTRFVDDREIPAIFAAAALCVLPYLEIDQSGVLATALAFSTPLLLSDVGGFPEVAALNAARTVPAGDPQALAAGISSLLRDPAALQALSDAGRSLATGDWSWERIAELHESLYRQVIARR
ncbi:MAG: glycosyltransferase [Actinobacteria bacterium]|uniref:Unannotated protein n=1 Tax=freshwater metagenome TaxID=449393 RepID=A0A6J7DHU8_9ZZZZ|nr:glycosyltransferase [Actinomycetota bacterium]